jgi:acetoacetyl-CoA synthetase
MELPVKKIFLGMPVEQVANRDAMANPDSLNYYMALAAQRAAGG